MLQLFKGRLDLSSISGIEQVQSLADEILLETTFSLSQPVTHEGISIVPIIKTENNDLDYEYINAVDALEQKLLEITEAGDAVNTIIAQNNGNIPILIEEAEVLAAEGSQDRIVVSNVILQPGECKRIPVKCVHAPHGLNRGAEFKSVGASSSPLRSMMRLQKYCSIMTDVEHYIAEDAIDQSSVWADVEKYGVDTGSEDETKYLEALSKRRKEVESVANEIRESLPDRTCGVIVIDSNGNIHSMEMYRSQRAFQKRSGFIESIVMDLSDDNKGSMEKEITWSKALQLLLKLKDIGDDEVIMKDGSDNIHISVEGLTGEAIIGNVSDSSKSSILYCSISK